MVELKQIFNYLSIYLFSWSSVSCVEIINPTPVKWTLLCVCVCVCGRREKIVKKKLWVGGELNTHYNETLLENCIENHFARTHLMYSLNSQSTTFRSLGVAPTAVIPKSKFTPVIVHVWKYIPWPFTKISDTAVFVGRVFTPWNIWHPPIQNN